MNSPTEEGGYKGSPEERRIGASWRSLRNRGEARKDAFGNKKEMLEEQSRQRKQHGQRLGDEI